MKRIHVIVLVILGIAAILGFIVGIFLLINGAMKGAAYEISLENVRSSPDMQQQLGTPIEPSYLVMGSISTSGGGSGHADLSYSVHGPDGSAKVYVIAEQRLGAWSIREQVAEIRGASDRVTLVMDGMSAGKSPRRP